MKEYQSLLAKQLAERKKRNPQFSLRSFAKVLEISPAQLSSLINGRKNLTPKQANKIIRNLDLDEEASQQLLHDMIPNAKQKRFQPPDEQTLYEEEFHLISDWEHFAILSLCRLKKNQAHSRWVAEQLGIAPCKALEALQRLEKLGLIKIEGGQMSQTTKPLKTSSDIPSAAIRKYHKQNLDLASEKLETIAVELREFSSVTMALNPKKLKKAKKMINEFRQRLCHELEMDDDAKAVYTFAMQLFPVSKNT